MIKGKMNEIDPKTWIRKYFIILSKDKELLFMKIKGIKEIILISKLIHIINHDIDDNINIVLINRVIKIIIIIGEIMNIFPRGMNPLAFDSLNSIFKVIKTLLLYQNNPIRWVQKYET